MNFKFQDKDEFTPPTVQFGESSVPDYNFNSPYDVFESLGLCELMEGVFEYPGKTEDQMRTLLLNLGYKEIEK